MTLDTVPEARSSAPYDGDVLDSFLHTPWLGGDDPQRPRGDAVDWFGDQRLARVMKTFHHVDASGEPIPRLTTSELLKAMDAQGVARAILPAKVYYRASEEGVRALHEQLATMVSESNGRLKAVGTIAPPDLGPGTFWDVMSSVRLVREAHEAGFIGIHLTPSPWGMPPNHKWLYPALAACAELDLAVFVHVGAPGPLWPMELQNPAHLDEVALAFPTLRLVAHHIGDPWTDMSVRLAARHQHFYICTSAWSPKRYPSGLLDFMRGGWHGVRGADKVIYASDFPLLDLERTTRDARALQLPHEALRAVLFDNANKLFWNGTSS